MWAWHRLLIRRHYTCRILDFFVPYCARKRHDRTTNTLHMRSHTHAYTHVIWNLSIPDGATCNLACVFFSICARCSQVLSVWMKNTVQGKLQAKYLLEVNDIGNDLIVHRFVCACVCNHVYLPYFTCHDIEKHLPVLLLRSLAL